MSSMLSAPAHIPATRVANFGAGFAAPDLIRETLIRTVSASRRASPVCWANVITGTSPAHDTRLSSSNTAESPLNLCDTFTGSALSDLDRLMRKEHQSSQLRGHFPRYDTQSNTKSVGGFRVSVRRISTSVEGDGHGYDGQWDRRGGGGGVARGWLHGINSWSVRE